MSSKLKKKKKTTKEQESGIARQLQKLKNLATADEIFAT